LAFKRSLLSGQDDGARKDMLKALEYSPDGNDPAIRKALRELDAEEGRKAVVGLYTLHPVDR
jgi:hypothetical protein